MARRLNPILLTVNIVGVAAFLWQVSYIWPIPEEVAAGIRGQTGEPIVWGLITFWAFVTFVPLNVGWGAFLVYRRQRSGARFWWATVAVWVLGLAIDVFHTFPL